SEDRVLPRHDFLAAIDFILNPHHQRSAGLTHARYDDAAPAVGIVTGMDGSYVGHSAFPQIFPYSVLAEIIVVVMAVGFAVQVDGSALREPGEQSCIFQRERRLG